MPATVPEDKSHITVVETDSDSDSEVPPLVSSNTSVSSDSSLGYLRIPVVGHTIVLLVCRITIRCVQFDFSVL